MNLMPTIISIGLAASVSIFYLNKQGDEPNKINYRAALSEFEQSAMAFAAHTPLYNIPTPPTNHCINIDTSFSRRLPAGSQWELDITGLDCDSAVLTINVIDPKDFKTLISAATASGRAQDADIDSSTKSISWTQRLYSRSPSDLGIRAQLKNNNLGTCLVKTCDQTNSLTAANKGNVKTRWTPFEDWGECYRGSKERKRICINADTAMGLSCPGSDTETKACNRPPSAADQKVNAVEQENKPINLVGNDPDQDPLSYTILSAPNGKAPINGSTVTYNSDSDTATNDSFTYRVCDDKNLCSNVATVTIDIKPVNDDPIANDMNITVKEQKDKQFNLYGSDPDDGTLTYTIVSKPSGKATINGSTVTYNSDSDTATNDSFTYKACDDDKACSKVHTVTIDITPVNDPPITRNQVANMNEGETLTLTLTATDPDDDDKQLKYSLVSRGSGVPTMVITKHGKNTNYVKYKLDKQQRQFTFEEGQKKQSRIIRDIFTFQACDTHSLCDQAVITVNVNEINDSPQTKEISRYPEKPLFDRPFSVEFIIEDPDYDFNSLPTGSYKLENKSDDGISNSWLSCNQNNQKLGSMKIRCQGTPIASDKTVSITIFFSDGLNEVPASEGEFIFEPIQYR